jgi:hypothetical protein
MNPRRLRGSGLSNPPKESFQFKSQLEERLWTGLLTVADSPTQKMVVTMFVFQGYLPTVE